jgi:nitroreductase
VTDPAKKAAIADYYRRAWNIYVNDPNRPAITEEDPRFEQRSRIVDSATYLVEHLHEVPILLIACVEGRFETAPQVMQASYYGSILPAAWSLMLALRARGIGAAWTTLHLMFEKEIARILGIPLEVTQAVLLPVAYFTGADFGPAKRLPPRDRTHWDSWGNRRQG